MSTAESTPPSPQHLEALALLAQHSQTFTRDHFMWRTDPTPESDNSFVAMSAELRDEDRVGYALVAAMPRIVLPGLMQDPYRLLLTQTCKTDQGAEENDTTQTYLSLQRAFATSDIKGESRLVAMLEPGIFEEPQRLILEPEFEISTRDIDYEAYEWNRRERLRQEQIEARNNPEPPRIFTEQEKAALDAELERRLSNEWLRPPEYQPRALDPAKYLERAELRKCRQREATTEEVMEFARLIGSLGLFDIKASGDGLA